MLLAIVAATAILAVLAPFAGRVLGRNAGWPLAAGLLVIGIGLWASSSTIDPTVSVPWIPSVDVEFALRLDGLSLLFSLLVLIIGAVVLAYSTRYLPDKPHGDFYGLMTLFAAAMLGLVLADDVIVLFVMWEITTLCSFFLIARSGPAARPSAIRTLLVTVAGGLSLLAAVVTASVVTGTTQLSAILDHQVWSDSPAVTSTVAVLVLVAGFTKSAQFPFHAWLPDAMAAATPVSAYLHAAAMVKAGIYLLMRFSEAFADVALWNTVLVTFGLVTALWGAILAMRAFDLKALLAYSTVSQLGLLVAVIGIGSEKALIAASAHTLAHALFKGSLFMFAGLIEHQGGSRDIRELSGLRKKMPFTTAAVALAALSMAGVPPLLGFISKENILEATLETPGPAWTGVAVAGVAIVVSILTFAYSARIVVSTFAGPLHDHAVTEARASFFIPAALPAAAGLLYGLWPALADPLVSGAASGSLGSGIAAELELWHGFSPPLYMSAFIIAVGVALVWARDRVETIMLRGALPFTALQAVEGLQTSFIRLGARVGDLTRSDSPTRHLAIPSLLIIAVAVVGVFTIGTLPEPAGNLSLGIDWVLVLLIAVGVAGALAVRSRLAAIAVIGVVGFGMTLWFFVLGAPDVAITQLLVEILTVIVMVLLLRRLPAKFHGASLRRTVVTGAIAIGAGIATTLGVLALTGRRELSDAGEYFMREAEDDTGGTNIVVTVLVDYRAMDTLGELTVLGIAGIAMMVLLRSRPLLPRQTDPIPISGYSPLGQPYRNAIFARALWRVLGPAMLAISIFFLLRGHYEPGGGFIAGLVAGAGFAVAYLLASSDSPARVRVPFVTVIGWAIIVSVVVGFVGYLDGAFLRPLHDYLFGVPLTTALVFDLGIYMAVIGVILGALNLLGRPAPVDLLHHDPPSPEDPKQSRSEAKEGSS